MVDFSYQNQSHQMVVLRCIGPNQFFFERVIFPMESLSFQAPEGSSVEIWGNEFYGPKLEERLRVIDKKGDQPLAA